MKAVKTNEPIVLDAHGRHAGSVYFTRDSRRLISVGQGGAIRLWSEPHFKPEGFIEGHAKGIWTMSFSPEKSGPVRCRDGPELAPFTA